MQREKQENNSPGLFDIINDISSTKRGIAISENGEIEKAFNAWMIIENFSHYENLCGLMVEASKLKVPDRILHSFLINAIPASKKRFSKWYREESGLKDKLEKISKYFECSNSEAEKLIAMLSEDDIIKILEIYEEQGPIKITGSKKAKKK